ncbi:uncharacterized protein LOC143976197 [Lithobates pipiens]
MNLRNTTSNISDTEEEGGAVDTQPAAEEDIGVGGREQAPEEMPSSQSTATLERRVPQRVPIRSVTTASRSKRHGQHRPDMDGAMLSFMQEMTAMRRADSNDPFADPNNEDASFVKNLYHHLSKVPTVRKMDVHMAIFNFTGVCVRAALSGDPMPPVITHPQRPYGEQASQHPYPHPYHHPGIIPHHQRAPAPTAQNFAPPPQVAPSSSPATSYLSSPQSSNPYPTSHSPYYQDL